MLKACVVGLGPMGRNHARVLSELSRVALTGAADPLVSARDSSRMPRGVTTYAEAGEMLARERPDLVVVAVPTELHCEVTCAALEAGAHVLVEKPIASTVAEADRMIATARRVGRQLMVGHVERFNPAVVELQRVIASGELGRIRHLHARRVGPHPGRARDVGVILDLATHDIDVMHFLTGARVVRVAAETTRREASVSTAGPEDLLAALLRFDDGSIGMLDVHWFGPTKVRELTVVADGGTYVADYLSQDVRLLRPSAGGVREGEPVSLAIEKREPLRLEHESFVECVLGGGMPFVTAEAGREALVVATRLLAAAHAF